MDTRKGYDVWSKQYDTNTNKTRDLEAKALRKTLSEVDFNFCLEIGCGTGKNTDWLIKKAKRITAVDLSKEMISKAKEKINSDRIQFLQADITNPWAFTKEKFDLITFSLVLEHIENLDFIFSEASKVIIPGGYLYLGELHPFKQYTGTKARFETKEGLQVLDCYNHNISDFTQSAKRSGFRIENISEYFDEEDRTAIPRILALLLIKK